MPRESLCEKTVDLEDKAVIFDFSDGTTLIIGLLELTPEVQLRAALHGLSQKIGDSFAGAKGSAFDANASAAEIIAQLKAGNWRAAREGTGEGTTRISLLVEAIARLKKLSVDVVRGHLSLPADAADEAKADLKAKIAELRKHSLIKATMADIAAERAKAELATAGDAGDIVI